MIRLLCFFIVLLIGLLSPQIFTAEDRPVRYLKDFQLEWENHRLSGKLKNVSVKILLEELSSNEGFQLEIIGDLDQRIDVFFDRLTLEQSIKKIMRLTNLNYAIMLDRKAPSDGKGPYRIKKLVVCRKDKRAQSSMTYRTRSQRQKRSLEKKPTPDEEEKAISPFPEIE